jgi:hypothetical protein
LNYVLTTIFTDLRQNFENSSPRLKIFFAGFSKTLRWDLKTSEDFSKSQRRLFKIPAKTFQNPSEEFLKSQRRVFIFPVKGF